MKKWIIIALLIVVSVTSKAGDFDLDLGHFTSVKVMGNFKVILKHGAEEKVEVHNSDENLEDNKIICRLENEELMIKIKADTYKERELEIVVTYTDINKITSKKGCWLTVKDVLKGDEIELLCEAGGKIRATVACKKLEGTISTGGSIHVDGKADEAKYKVGAGGTIAAVRVVVKKVNAVVTAGGEIICAVIDDLTIKITSGGNVSYRGDPKTYSEKVKLGGKIEKMK